MVIWNVMVASRREQPLLHNQTCLLLGISLCAIGCSGGSSVTLAPVSGTVALDGQPLAGAQVVFIPKEGRQSTAVTDESGHYVLQYTRDKAGALIGTHTVKIHTAFPGRDPRSAEKLPPRYNFQSQLTKEVKAGENDIDFELTSGGG